MVDREKVKRRPKGTGSLTAVSPGVWRLRVYVGTDPITRRPRQVERIYRGSKTGAGKKLRDLLGEVERGQHSATNATVSELLDAWVAHRVSIGRRRPTTAYSSKSIIERHLKPRLGHLQIGKVTPRDLDDHYAAMLTAGLAPGTVRLHHNLLSGAFAQADRWGWVSSNPARRASPPSAPRQSSRSAPSTEQVRALVLAAGDDIDVATAVVLAVITGARRGELCGLQWPDVDWHRRQVTFRRNRVPVAGGDQTGPLKSGDERPVLIGDAGVAVLARYRAVLAVRAVDLRVTMPADGWLLSYDCGLTPMRTKGLSESVAALGRRSGVKVTLHELRHYAATEMIAGGTDVTTAAARLGNGPEVLLRVYSQVRTAQDRATAELLEGGVLGPVKPLDTEVLHRADGVSTGNTYPVAAYVPGIDLAAFRARVEQSGYPYCVQLLAD